MEVRKWVEAVGGGVALQFMLLGAIVAAGGSLDTSYLEKMEKDPLEVFVASNFTGPAIEEITFRGLPLLLFPAATLGGPVGLITNTAFTLSHGGFYPDVFLKGYFYWYIAQKHGLRGGLAPAIAAHSATNLTYFGALATFY